MAKKSIVLILILIVVAAIVAAMFFRGEPEDLSYNPVINPAEFTTEITNPYVALTPGKKLIYETKTKDGIERIEMTVTGETKIILGVETLVAWDRVWVNGILEEDTRDYLAQDAEGNVWFFGEDVDEYNKRGEIIGHAGSWLAGIDGAKPGIWMTGNPRVSDSYRQVYYWRNAEDMVEILGVDESITTAVGTFHNCLKTYDWTPLDRKTQEHKYFCPEVGGSVLEENIITGERVELIEVIE